MRAAALLPAAALAVALAPWPAQAGDLDAALGRALFERLWVAAPASTRSADGLGPHHDARSCAACHPGGGRGRAAPGTGGPEAPPGLVLRLAAAPGIDAPHPAYGRQLQRRAVPGQAAEGRLEVRYAEAAPAALAGGGAVPLRRPEPVASDLAFGPPPPPAARSLRLAPALRGLGRLEAVPAAAILAWADPADADGDGISGRPNRIGPAGEPGRFGWKAGTASLPEQTARALATDLGLSSAALPGPWGDCTAAQAACRAGPHGRGGPGDGHEAGAAVTGLLLAHVRALPAPPGPPAGPVAGVEEATGRELFEAVGCAACHRPALPVPGGEVRAFTDLLLHDLGEGLADGVAEGEADGAEWRTAPLWGIGAAARAPGAGLLHDGRARSLAEAVLWHGGEAAAARDRFAALPPGERAALMAFLEAL